MRRRRWLMLSLVVIVALFWLGWAGTKGTDSSNYCASCHFMKPFYDNWQSSSHATVNCTDCHYDHGFKGYVAGKLRLAGEVVRYWVGAYNVRPHARVSDQNCLSCHPEKALEKTALYQKKIPFSHVKHYGNPARGIELTCTTCHSQLVQGNHLAIDESACILCHFIGVARNQTLTDCNTCHGPPKDQIVVRGVTFNHSTYLQKSGVDCLTCHVHVTQGSGDVPREKCFSCHVERFQDYGKTELVHRTHVTEQKLKCTDCHSDLKHGKFEIAQALSPDCAACHGGRHSVQEEVYIGTGGLGVGTMPDPMFLSSVTCAGCHQTRVELDALSRTKVSTAAGPDACVNCHGSGYDRLMKGWQHSIASYLDELKAKLVGFEKRLQAVKDDLVRQLQPLYDEARKNVQLIEEDQSKGVHNIHYAEALLERSEESLARATSLLDGKEFSMPSPLHSGIRYGCSRCHVGIDRLPMGQSSQATLHGAHLVKNDCNICHVVKPTEHGKTLASAQDCSTCHPSAQRMAALQPQDCLQCHQTQVPTRSEKVKFPHDKHVNYGLACSICHENVNQLDHLEFLKSGKGVPRLDHNYCIICHRRSFPPESNDCSKCHVKF